MGVDVGASSEARTKAEPAYKQARPHFEQNKEMITELCKIEGSYFEIAFGRHEYPRREFALHVR